MNGSVRTGGERLEERAHGQQDNEDEERGDAEDEEEVGVRAGQGG